MNDLLIKILFTLKNVKKKELKTKWSGLFTLASRALRFKQFDIYKYLGYYIIQKYSGRNEIADTFMCISD